MAMSSRESALRTTLAAHLRVAPLWVVRIAANGLRHGLGIVFLIALDMCLAVLHWRANRVSEVADRERFGENNSWTKLLYVPELLAAYNVVLDLWQAYRLFKP
jgi:hypothetical protein